MGQLKRFSKENHLLKDDILCGFTPTHFIYRMLSHDGRGYYYSDRALKKPISDITGGLNTIEAFVRYLQHGGTVNWDQEPREEHNPDGSIQKLAIPIHDPVYVIIQLDRNLPFTFDNNYDAVSFGEYEDDDIGQADLHCGGVQHVDTAGVLAKRHTRDCRIAVFAALPKTGRPMGSRQFLNFNVVDGYGTDATIDPDIRYPGTGGIDDENGGTP